MDRIEEKRQEWLNKLPANPIEDEIRAKVEEELRKRIRRNSVGIIGGAFGDAENCDAYIESITKPETGGTFCKFYGCNYLYPGYPESKIVDEIAAPKRVIISTINLLLGNPLNLRRILHWYVDICEAGHYRREIPQIEFSRMQREIMRAGYEIAKTHDEKRLVYHIAKILEFDNAYGRSRIQDVLSNLNKSLLKRGGVIREVNRLFLLGISRETHVDQKMRQMRKIVLLALIISPRMRRTVRDFLSELNLDEIRPTEDDIYFSLLRRGYDYMGMNLIERIALKKQMDVKKENIIITA